MENKFNFIENRAEHISDIKDYIFRVLANWKWFVFTVIIALGIAYYFNISAQKIYGLSTTIAVKEKQNPLFSSGTNIAFNWGGVSDKVESIRKSLISRTHNEKVVRRLKFYIQYLKEGRFRSEDVYGKTNFEIQLQPNQYQLLNTPIKINFIDDESFKLSVDFNLDSQYNLINYKDGSTKKLSIENETFSRTYLINEYINLPFLKAQIAITDSLKSLEGQSFFIQLKTINQTTQQYQNIRAKGLAGTSLVELSLTGANKNRIVDFLNKTVEVLSEYELEQKTNYAYSTKRFIDAQFKNTSDSLKLIEDNIEDFKEKNSIYNLSAEGGVIFSETTGLDKMQEQLTDRIEYLDNLENYIKSNSDYTRIPAPAIINIEDGSIASMVGELTSLSIKKEKLRNEVTSNHPSLKLVNDEIETARNVLLENLSSLKDAIKVNLKNSERRLNTYNYELTKLPNKEQQLLNFERKYRLTESNFVFLMQKRYEADIAIAASVSDISVLDLAKDTGQGAILPRVSFNYMIALLLGIILPLFVIIAKEILDNKVYTTEDIERISPIPILGVIGKNIAENNLAVYLKPKSSVSESFRGLRSNIQFLFSRDVKDKSKTIIVTSSVSGEGKTFISINLATVFALGGKKTILVGLDLRKPKIFGDFEITNKKGVVNYLIGEEKQSAIIQHTKIENLDVITSGPIPPNPSELLIGDATDELMKNLKEQYDYIILDTPPIGLVSDSLELVKYADSTIYVVRQGYSEKGMLKMINDKYRKQEISNISIVLNDFKVKSKYGYGYGYGYGKYANGYHEVEEMSFLKKLFRFKK
ncbi:MAG: polysaccharide biosynthesis tyrosine autokinase [Lutibacter sp.]|uniref:exopolysaccharide transport family protein n=1 Tax=Lutibacter sp. TaxID=1925666 RepID=UPI00180C7DAF|nr:tyrosine-protein kinase family protein [Lutibacter sp.]MBT8316135.1 polysaccharide biosynthesis tyrosine autokinase [Lutibacter sp.]NNJ56995.1 polysaccharide biosynthesis tyrosine autokinase [Lutibacter sp.]